jgi:hypothetical protein
LSGLAAFLESVGDKELSERLGGEIGDGVGVFLHLNASQHWLDSAWSFRKLVHRVNLKK